MPQFALNFSASNVKIKAAIFVESKLSFPKKKILIIEDIAEYEIISKLYESDLETYDKSNNMTNSRNIQPPGKKL